MHKVGRTWQFGMAKLPLRALIVSIVLMTTLPGCIFTQYTELPTLTPKRHPLVEKQVYRIHDPFTDATLGPDLGVRPREFNIPRSDAKRASEVYFGLNLPKYYPLPWPFSLNPYLNGARPITLQ